MEERIIQLEKDVEALKEVCLHLHSLFDTLYKHVEINDKEIDTLGKISKTLKSYCNLNSKAIKEMKK